MAATSRLLREDWHAIEDLLTVWYWQVRALPGREQIVVDNAGDGHSRLSAEDLGDLARIRSAVEAALLVNRGPVSPPSLSS